MITHTRYTGYQNSCGKIRYVTTWSLALGNSGEMYFLPPDFPKASIADFTLEINGDINVGTYNFSNPNHISLLAEKLQEEIGVILQVNFEETGDRTATLSLTDDRGVQVITRELFQRYYPHYQVSEELFTFNLPEDEGGFPNLYFMTKEHQSGVNTNALQVLAESSHVTYLPVAQNPSAFAKEFVYILYQSKCTGRFNADIPLVSDINFPTNGQTKPKYDLNIAELEKVFQDAGVDKILQTSVGTSSASSEEEMEDGIIITDASGKSRPLNEWEESIIRDALTYDRINLSDLFNAGVGKTLELLGSTEIYLDVFPDLPGIARRMCIFQNKVHVIPIDNRFDPEDFFGEPLELFAIHDDESFPHRVIIGKK